MYTRTIKTNHSTLILNDTLVLPYSTDNTNNKLNFIENNPIKIDINFQDEFLFAIKITFSKNNLGKPSIGYEVSKEDSKDFEIEINNLHKTSKNVSFSLPEATLLAKTIDNKEFYISLSVSSSPYAYLLSYTIFFVEEGDNFES